MFKLCLKLFKFYCYQIMREDIEIDGGKVIVCLIHSMFSMADMVEPASPIMAVFRKKYNKLLDKCHPWIFISWPSQHLGDIAYAGAYSNCSGEFSTKNSDFRDKGLKSFS